MDKRPAETGVLNAGSTCRGYQDFLDPLRYSAIEGQLPLKPVSLRDRLGRAIATAGLAVRSRITPLGDNMNYLGLLQTAISH